MHSDLAHFAGREDSAVPKEAAEKLSEWVPPAGSATYEEYRQECARQASMLDLSDDALQMAWSVTSTVPLRERITNTHKNYSRLDACFQVHHQ